MQNADPLLLSFFSKAAIVAIYRMLTVCTCNDIFWLCSFTKHL